MGKFGANSQNKFPRLNSQIGWSPPKKRAEQTNRKWDHSLHTRIINDFCLEGKPRKLGDCIWQSVASKSIFGIVYLYSWPTPARVRDQRANSIIALVWHSINSLPSNKKTIKVHCLTDFRVYSMTVIVAIFDLDRLIWLEITWTFLYCVWEMFFVIIVCGLLEKAIFGYGLMRGPEICFDRFEFGDHFSNSPGRFPPSSYKVVWKSRLFSEKMDLLYKKLYFYAKIGLLCINNYWNTKFLQIKFIIEKQSLGYIAADKTFMRNFEQF